MCKTKVAVPHHPTILYDRIMIFWLENNFIPFPDQKVTSHSIYVYILYVLPYSTVAQDFFSLSLLYCVPITTCGTFSVAWMSDWLGRHYGTTKVAPWLPLKQLYLYYNYDVIPYTKQVNLKQACLLQMQSSLLLPIVSTIKAVCSFALIFAGREVLYSTVGGRRQDVKEGVRIVSGYPTKHFKKWS